MFPVCRLASVGVEDIGLLSPNAYGGWTPNPTGFTSMVGRVGFEPTITGARDQYPSRVESL